MTISYHPPVIRVRSAWGVRNEAISPVTTDIGIKSCSRFFYHLSGSRTGGEEDAHKFP